MCATERPVLGMRPFGRVPKIRRPLLHSAPSPPENLSELGREQTGPVLGVEHTVLLFISGAGLHPRARLRATLLLADRCASASLPLPCAPSNSVDAASGWRAHAAATNCRVPRDHPPCRSRCSAAHPMGSLLMGKALACARKRAPLLSCSFVAI